MWDEPNLDDKVPKYSFKEPKKGVFEYRQLDGGLGSRSSANDCVTTHQPNSNALKMNGAKTNENYTLIHQKEMKREQFHYYHFFCRLAC